ncbi:MAG: hypothetical protein LBJ69_00565 [Holosporales bacterium]|jgi:hypothetical protein|nr:hypothetical protein [Holosporales bacterium]
MMKRILLGIVMGIICCEVGEGSRCGTIPTSDVPSSREVFFEARDQASSIPIAQILNMKARLSTVTDDPWIMVRRTGQVNVHRIRETSDHCYVHIQSPDSLDTTTFLVTHPGLQPGLFTDALELTTDIRCFAIGATDAVVEIPSQRAHEWLTKEVIPLIPPKPGDHASPRIPDITNLLPSVNSSGWYDQEATPFAVPYWMIKAMQEEFSDINLSPMLAVSCNGEWRLIGNREDHYNLYIMMLSGAEDLVQTYYILINRLNPLQSIFNFERAGEPELLAQDLRVLKLTRDGNFSEANAPEMTRFLTDTVFPRSHILKIIAANRERKILQQTAMAQRPPAKISGIEKERGRPIGLIPEERESTTVQQLMAAAPSHTSLFSTIEKINQHLINVISAVQEEPTEVPPPPPPVPEVEQPKAGDHDAARKTNPPVAQQPPTRPNYGNRERESSMIERERCTLVPIHPASTSPPSFPDSSALFSPRSKAVPPLPPLPEVEQSKAGDHDAARKTNQTNLLNWAARAAQGATHPEQIDTIIQQLRPITEVADPTYSYVADSVTRADMVAGRDKAWALRQELRIRLKVMEKEPKEVPLPPPPVPSSVRHQDAGGSDATRRTKPPVAQQPPTRPNYGSRERESSIMECEEYASAPICQTPPPSEPMVVQGMYSSRYNSQKEQREASAPPPLPPLPSAVQRQDVGGPDAARIADQINLLNWAARAAQEATHPEQIDFIINHLRPITEVADPTYSYVANSETRADMVAGHKRAWDITRELQGRPRG